MVARVRMNEAEPSLAALVDRVAAGGAPVIIDRDGGQAAVLINLETWERFQQIARDLFAEIVQHVHQATADMDPAEIEAIEAEIADAAEEERRKHYERWRG